MDIKIGAAMIAFVLSYICIEAQHKVSMTNGAAVFWSAWFAVGVFLIA